MGRSSAQTSTEPRNKLGPLTLRHSCRVRATEAPDRDDSLTHGLDARLQAQLTFLVEVDHLKTVLRQSPLAADQRRENDAEHSWHLAMMVTIPAEHSDEPIDVGHATQLVLVHDLIEIYAGDTPLYDDDAGAGQEHRERVAADDLFTLLPEDQARTIRALWDEFEARLTAEACFAKAMDRLQPLLLNWMPKVEPGHHPASPPTTSEPARLSSETLPPLCGRRLARDSSTRAKLVAGRGEDRARNTTAHPHSLSGRRLSRTPTLTGIGSRNAPRRDRPLERALPAVAAPQGSGRLVGVDLPLV